MSIGAQLILPRAELLLRSARADFPMQELGKLLIVFGIVVVLLGAALWSGLGGGWLGRLPGDIRIERENSGFYFPVVTCIIISIVLSVIISFLRR